MLFRLITIICFFCTGYCTGAVRYKGHEEIEVSDTVSAIMNRVSKLDSSLTKEEVLFVYKNLQEKKLNALIKYDAHLKSLIFEEKFSLTAIDHKKIKKLFRTMPLGFASQYLNHRRIGNTNHKNQLKDSEGVIRVLESAIYQTGEGTWEHPFEILSFYDAYFFVTFLSGQLPQKGDYFLDESNRLLGAFQYYRGSDDSIQIVYFKLDHLKDHYKRELSFRQLNAVD